MKILFLLIAAHALCDFSLQGDLMANAKNRFKPHPIHRNVPWYYWLASHAMIHGLAVGLITGNPFFGACETIAHFLIDDLKCEGFINIHHDQSLHIACKLIWFGLWLIP